MMGTPRKGDKSAIQSKLLFKFYNVSFISISNSEQKKTNKQKNMSFIAGSKFYKNF